MDHDERMERRRKVTVMLGLDESTAEEMDNAYADATEHLDGRSDNEAQAFVIAGFERLMELHDTTFSQEVRFFVAAIQQAQVMSQLVDGVGGEN